MATVIKFELESPPVSRGAPHRRSCRSVDGQLNDSENDFCDEAALVNDCVALESGCVALESGYGASENGCGASENDSYAVVLGEDYGHGCFVANANAWESVAWHVRLA